MFRNLTERNNWESITTFIGTVKTGRPLMVGGKYRVRWPDGTEETITVKMVPYTTSYEDMGHTYEASGHRPFTTFRHNGSILTLPLAKLKLKVWDK